MIVESFVLILWRSNFQPAFSMGVAPIIADRFPRDYVFVRHSFFALFDGTQGREPVEW